MNWINEYIEPGTYQHYKGGMYVVTEVVTHMENESIGKIEKMPMPLVVYRDLHAIVEHDVNGKPVPTVHKRYARKLSEFEEIIIHNDKSVKRFTKI